LKGREERRGEERESKIAGGKEERRVNGEMEKRKGKES
jgi:hypothetical protein